MNTIKIFKNYFNMNIQIKTIIYVQNDEITAVFKQSILEPYL